MTEASSPFGFEQTVAVLVSAIENAGMHVVARVDHAAAARAVGLDLRPTTVLFYGNPAKGTPVMVAHARAALDLPLHVLVFQDAGTGEVRVCFHPIAPLLEAAGVDPTLAASLAPAQEVLVHALANAGPHPEAS